MNQPNNKTNVESGSVAAGKESLGCPSDSGRYQFVVSSTDAGQRLDLYLADYIAKLSRSVVGNLIRSGHVHVNGSQQKAGYRLKKDDNILTVVPLPEPSELIPEDIPFQIIFEDNDLVVVSKPPGLVVHPACGHQTGTLVHGLLGRCMGLSGISGQERPGIVHRLDRDTSGVMVVAKNDLSHQALAQMFKDREVTKVYHAIIDGRPRRSEGRISLPIGRHPVKRKKMAVREKGGRNAATQWKVVEQLPGSLVLVELRPETGRTHQLRVHMAHLGHPIAGDALYGRKNEVYAKLGVKRQCLHASSLSFVHPVSGREVSFAADLWPDMVNILNILHGSSEEGS